jgi:hypothetical protein
MIDDMPSPPALPCLVSTQNFFTITSNIWHIHEALNIDKKLITQFKWKQQDESFKPN